MKLACGISVHSIPALNLNTDQRLRWDAWIKSLTAGTYKQGVGGLHNKKGEFCFLGVACDLIDNTRWEQDNVDENDMRYKSLNHVISEMSECSFPPPDIAELYGFERRPGFEVCATYYDNGKRIDSTSLPVSVLNDMGATFEELAEVLKKAMTGGYVS